MGDVTILGGSASVQLAKNIAKSLNGKFVKGNVKIFPDGENKIRLSSKLQKTKIIVVQALYPPVDTNLVQMLSLVIEARRFTKNLTLVIPYMGYARQDRVFMDGELITIDTIAKLVAYAGVSSVITVDMHSDIGLGRFKVPIKNTSAIPDLAKYFANKKLKNILVVSPDLGGWQRAKKFASIVNLPCMHLTKHRDRKTGTVKIATKSIDDIVNKDIILVDDMISTGNSIVKSVEFLKKQKCGKIFVVCTHGLLINDAVGKITKAGVKNIICANTIPRKDVTTINITKLLVEAIKNN